MIRVVIEVRAGAAWLNVAVQAENIQRAVRLLGSIGNFTWTLPVWYRATTTYFVKDSEARARLVANIQLEPVAA